MSLPMSIFGLRRNNDWMDDTRKSYRPPSWPPPRDWVVSEDRDGNILSHWGDTIWNLSPWAGTTCTISFSDDVSKLRKNEYSLDGQNADLLRLIATWKIWGIKSCYSVNGFLSSFFILKKIIVLCSKNGVLANNLSDHPHLIDKIAELAKPGTRSKLILELHRLLDASDKIGFTLIDRNGIQRLSQLERCDEHEQTAYIPPRIWTYIVLRLSECIEDYLSHKESIEKCYNYCLEAYNENRKIVTTSKRSASRNPFHFKKTLGQHSTDGHQFHGPFSNTIEKFHIQHLIEKWVEVPKSGVSILHLTSYMGLVQTACAGYIASFTLQRIDEVSSLRYNCMHWEYDDHLGRILTVIGSTTKTDRDSDACWVTSPNVENAILALQSICKLRMLCKESASEDEIKNPYLFTTTQIPWLTKKSQNYATRIRLQSASSITLRYKKLLETFRLRVIPEDIDIALKITPTISGNPKFIVGTPWHFTWHQLRRTGAVNMLSSGIISESTLQFLMKHASRLMPLYYGQGYTKLLLNEETSSLIVRTMYETVALRIQAAIGDRFVSPLGQETKNITLINLISDKDLKQLAKSAERGTVFFRETRAGACTHRGPCEYGGIESISRCAGSDGSGPCPDALYDREKVPGLTRQLKELMAEAEKIPSDHPRHKYLMTEAKGIENILNVLK